MPCSCCVRSAVLVLEHIALAPAAIAAPVSMAEHIAPFLQVVFAKVEMHAESELPALEKYELVERLVRALELGQFPEEYDDSRDALVRFARRLTHHLDAIGQLQQMNDSATSQLDGMRASRVDHVEAYRQQEVRRWTSVLGMVHTEVLGQLGLAHTDPEHCFDKVLGRTFARCCSVGEHVAECWPRELSEDVSVRELVSRRPWKT